MEKSMSQKAGPLFIMVTIILCGLPGMLAALGGIFVAGLGLLADKAQLKLDTNLDQSSLIWTGLGGIGLGVILVAVPFFLWLWSKRQ
jgi:hypothetical protein